MAIVPFRTTSGPVTTLGIRTLSPGGIGFTWGVLQIITTLTFLRLLLFMSALTGARLGAQTGVLTEGVVTN